MFNKKSIIELKKDLNNECFSRKTCSFYKYIKIENIERLTEVKKGEPVVFFRADRKSWITMISLEHYMDLLRNWK